MLYEGIGEGVGFFTTIAGGFCTLAGREGDRWDPAPLGLGCKSFGNCEMSSSSVLFLFFLRFLKAASALNRFRDRWADFRLFSFFVSREGGRGGGGGGGGRRNYRRWWTRTRRRWRHCLRRWHDLFHDRRLIHWRESCHRQSHAHLCLRRW